MQQNIFKNIYSSRATATESIFKNDYNVTEPLLEALMVIEDEYMKINMEHLQATHLAIKTSNPEILTEGLGDFFKSAGAFFRNMLNSFTAFMKKIFMIIRSYIGDFDKFISTYKDKIKDLSPNFSVKGYEYNFIEGIPKLDKIFNIIESFNSDISDIDNITTDQILKDRDEYTNEAYMNQVRASVLNEGGEVSPENFMKSIHEKFRGSTEEIDITVDKPYISKIVTDYPKLKTMAKNVSTEKDKVIRTLEAVKNFFEKGASIQYSATKKVITVRKIDQKSDGGITNGESIDHDFNDSYLKKVNVFYNYKFKQAKELTVIAVTSLSEKINLIKEAMKMYRVILRRAMFAKAS